MHGTILLALKRLPEAEAAFRRAFELAPDYPTYGMSLARLLVGQGRRDEARRVVDALVDKCADKSQLKPWLNEIEAIRTEPAP